MGGRLGLTLSWTVRREKVQPTLFLGQSRKAWVVISTAESGRAGATALLFPEKMGPAAPGEATLSAHTGTISLMGGPDCRQGFSSGQRASGPAAYLHIPLCPGLARTSEQPGTDTNLAMPVTHKCQGSWAPRAHVCQ